MNQYKFNEGFDTQHRIANLFQKHFSQKGFLVVESGKYSLDDMALKRDFFMIPAEKTRLMSSEEMTVFDVKTNSSPKDYPTSMTITTHASDGKLYDYAHRGERMNYILAYRHGSGCKGGVTIYSFNGEEMMNMLKQLPSKLVGKVSVENGSMYSIVPMNQISKDPILSLSADEWESLK